VIAATDITIKRVRKSNDPSAVIAPAAKRSESPGKNGVTTSPVSQKIIINRIRYAHTPYDLIIASRYMSICNMTSMKFIIKSIGGSSAFDLSYRFITGIFTDMAECQKISGNDI
jgi:hypothetical protein